MGSLINGGEQEIIQLMPAAGTLTGGRQLISKVETEVETWRSS